jgi:apolipoprotein N-acyltransferase
MPTSIERADGQSPTRDDAPGTARPRRLGLRRPRFRRPRPGVHWFPQLTAAASGLLLVAAFPPIGWWWLAPFCVAGFTLSAHTAASLRARRGLRRPAAAGAWAGLWFGLGFCVLTLQWLTSVGTDAWIVLSVVEALYFVPLGAATAAVGRLRGAVLWQALLWIAEEALRDRWPLHGMSWARLAFSQSHTVFTPLAALGGAPLVSFATALAGTALAALLLTARRATRRGRDSAVSSTPDVPAVSAVPAVSTVSTVSWVAAVGWLVLAVAVPTVGWLVPLQTTAGRPVELAAIQGNVPRTGLDAYGQMSAVLNNHVAVTEQYAAQIAAGRAPQPAAVFWPEDSDDVDPFTDPAAAALLTQAAAAVHTQILVGTVAEDGPTRARNEGVVWDPHTGPGATYTKQHLVPFGEYIPYRAQLTRFISELSRVPRDYVAGDKPGVLTVGGVKIADVICFEVAYDDDVRNAVRGGGGVIVVQTNNATYGWTGQPEQQLAISQLRAVEHGRPVMIAATSGISGYITPDGNVHQETRQFTSAVVAAEVTPRTGLTLADRAGIWPELAMTAAALAAWALASLTGRRRAVARPPAQQSMQPPTGPEQSVLQQDESSDSLSGTRTPPARKART